MMTYEETIQYLYDSVPMFQKVGATAYKEGLSNTIALDEHFGHPHRKFKTVHVAGTNGKGSCSHTIASILQAEGYKVGLYTSPHLVDFRERIRINGECVSKEYVVGFVERERDFFEPLCPSFFELTTALAFKYFADEEVDYAVIEVGLGGRLDCTNIIKPVLSVITNISFDHTQFLGDTLAKIASEKAGIIKGGTPVVIGEYCAETRPVFEAKACEMKAPIVFAEDEHEILSATPCAEMADYESKKAPTHGISYQTRHFGSLTGELTGSYQIKNTATVLCAVSRLIEAGVIRNRESVGKGMATVVETTGLHGRWEKIHDCPTAICDTGHNSGGWQYLSAQLKGIRCDRIRIVFGMVDDKDIDAVMAMLPTDAVYYFTQASTKRAIPSSTVMEKARHHNLMGNAFADVTTAYRKALEDAGTADFIFVGGSSYVVADLLSSQPLTR